MMKLYKYKLLTLFGLYTCLSQNLYSQTHQYIITDSSIPRIMKELCLCNPVPSLKHPKRRPVLGKTPNRRVRGNFIGSYCDSLYHKH